MKTCGKTRQVELVFKKNYSSLENKEALITFLRQYIHNPAKHLRRKLFEKIVNGFQSLIIFAKSFILDVWF